MKSNSYQKFLSKNKIFFLAIFFSLGPILGESEDIHYANQGETNSKNSTSPFYIVIAGQSNALGRGKGSGSLSKTPDDHLQIWNLLNGAFETWDLTRNSTQLSPTITSDGTSGAGPTNNAYNFAFSMAHGVIRDTGRDVFVVIEAEGGETINNFIPASSGHFSRLTNSLSESGIPRIDAFIWQQGETDARTATVDDYAEDLSTLYDQVKDLAQWQEDSLFMVGTMSYPWLEKNPELTNLNPAFSKFRDEESDSRIRVVETGWCEVTPNDEVHFSAEGLIMGGEKYWESYHTYFSQNLTPNPSDFYWSSLGESPIRLNGREISFTFNTRQDQSYRIYGGTDLSKPEIWNEVTSGAIIGTGGIMSISIPREDAPASSFFHIREE